MRVAAGMGGASRGAGLPRPGAPSAAAAQARVGHRLARNDVLDATTGAMRDLLGLRLAVLARPAQAGGRLALVAARDYGAWPSPSRQQRAAMLALVQAAWPAVADSLAPMVVADAACDRALAGLAAGAALGVRGYVAVPVVGPDGACWGVLGGMDRRAPTGSVAEAGLVQVLARLLAVQWQRDGVARARGVRLVTTTAQHELNNALGKVVFRAQLLEEEPGLPPELLAASVALQERVGLLAAALRTLRGKRPGAAL